MEHVLCPLLIERDGELAVLEGLVERATAGGGGLVLLVGEAGAGKSRLARVAAGSAAARGVMILSGRALPGPTPVPYRPLTEAFAAPFRHRAPLVPRDLAALRERIGRLLPDWPGPTQGREPHGAESPIQLAEAVVRLLHLLGRDHGTVLVLEDLHWADVETLDVVDYLADALGELGVVVLATMRPDPPVLDRLARWRRHPEVTLLALEPLSEAGVRRAVAACLGTDAPPPEAVGCVAADSEGNPFLVEELLAGLVTSGRLVREDGAWTVTGALRPSVPFDFAASLRPRLDALDPTARTVLSAAALLGRRFDWELLADVAAVDADRAVEALRAAATEQLIETDGDDFRFRHALTREAVLQRLLPPERRRLAERAWPAVERANPGLPGAWCELAADLAEAAGDRAAAAERLAESARRALVQGALASAENTARRAGALARQSRAAASLVDRIDHVLTEALALAGKPEAALEVGEPLAARLAGVDGGGQERRAEVLTVLARALVASGQWSRAAGLIGEAERVVGGAVLGPAARARVDAVGALVALERGSPDEAVARATAAVDAAAATAQPAVECEARLVLGRARRNADDAGALAEFDRAARLAASHGLTAWELRARHERSLLQAYGDGDHRGLHETRELAAEVGALVTVAVMDLAISEIALAAWDAAAAIDHGRRCVAASRRFGLATGPVASLWEAGGHALAGDEPAMEHAIAEALRPDPADPRILGDVWGKVRAIRSMVLDDRDQLRRDLDEMMRWVRIAPITTSVFESRFVWSVLHAVEDDDGEAARAELTRATHLAGWSVFIRTLLDIDAVLAGRGGDGERATELMEESMRMSAGRPDMASAHYIRILVAEAAVRDGWGDPVRWLRESEAHFATRGYERVARRCRRLLGEAGAPVPRPGRGDTPVPEHLRALGVTSREMDVLLLVAEGLTNREVAGRLYLSPKTVERHLTSLFNRTGAGSRGQLGILLTPEQG
jgi:DNA-binding CsgD family transcriptional regulator